MTDEQVMLEVSKGNLSRATILFERYSKHLYNFFVRLTYDRDLSQDMTQTVFERMLKYRNSFKYGKTFKSWIFQIARNVKNDYYQKEQKRFSQFTDIDSIQLEICSQSTHNEQDIQERHLEQAMLRLDAEQREILILSKYQQMKYEEIAETLDCSVANVKVKVHRAIKKLRTLYFMVEQS